MRPVRRETQTHEMCCFVCYEKFVERSDPPRLQCPHCGSLRVHPIGKRPIVLTAYHGVIGARN